MSMAFQHPFQESQFDIFDWYPKFCLCLSYFLDNAQHNTPVQAVAAFVNIRLPFQKPIDPASPPVKLETIATLVPYIRRLVATGFDSPAILHGFFGEDWTVGIGPIHEAERKNYLFAAKSDTWLKVKASYDMNDGQIIPFLRPLQNVTEQELLNAETSWSEWLAMQDWMLGPRAPSALSDRTDDSRMKESQDE